MASDLDLMAISPSPRVGYRTWFEEQSGDAPPIALALRPPRRAA